MFYPQQSKSKLIKQKLENNDEVFIRCIVNPQII